MQRNVLALDGQLCFALYNASRAMSQAYRPMLAELDLTYPQYLALLALWEQDGASVSAIGARLDLDSGTLTPLLKRLETRGLVTRVRSPQDERIVRIFLTPEGHALRATAEQLPVRMLACTGLSEGELGALRRAVQALTESVRTAPPPVLAVSARSASAAPKRTRAPKSSPPTPTPTPTPHRKPKTP